MQKDVMSRSKRMRGLPPRIKFKRTGKQIISGMELSINIALFGILFWAIIEFIISAQQMMSEISALLDILINK